MVARRRLTHWLREQGHDVREATEISPDPGEQALLEWAVREERVIVTLDSDFGLLVFFQIQPHTGIVRLPDVPAAHRIGLMAQLIERYADDLADGAILTVGTERVRVSHSASSSS